jgi:hypothetical protein
MSDDSPTLAHVFALSEKIKLNMVEERMVTSEFNRDTTITSRGQQSTSQLRSGGGGSRGGQGRPQSSSRGIGAQRPLFSFAGQQQGQFCWNVVVLIFGGIVHKKVVDGLWLMDLSRHKFSVITMAGSATFVNVVLTFTQN